MFILLDHLKKIAHVAIIHNLVDVELALSLRALLVASLNGNKKTM